MNTKQVVAVIGASGNMGSALARSLSKGNYRILLRSSRPDAVQSLLSEVKNSRSSADVEVVDDDIEACWEADVIILAVPYAVQNRAAETIRSVVNQKVVISIANPLNDRCNGLLTQPGISAAEELQRQLPNAKVVKAFNTVFATDFDQPVIQEQRLDCFIAGDDEEALEIVYDLVKTAGFNPVMAGDLSLSGTLESMQLLLIQLVAQSKYKGMTGWKILQN